MSTLRKRIEARLIEICDLALAAPLPLAHADTLAREVEVLRKALDRLDADIGSRARAAQLQEVPHL